MRVHMGRVMTALVPAACLLWCATAHAADIVETARATAVKFQKAVVTIRLVVKVKMDVRGQNMDQEQKLEATGVVIDPSGLTVADASSLDPAALVKAILGGMGGMGFKVDTELKETMLLLDDGSEVDAEVVLTDVDLGLAFIRPKDGSQTFDAVALKQRAAPAQALDDVIVLGRLGKLGNRAATLSLDSIRAVVKGPRFFYAANGQGETGTVAFAADGEVLGVYVMKHAPSKGSDERGSGFPISMFTNPGEMKNMLMPIIRPVNDVIEIAAQAKRADRPAATGPGDTEGQSSPKAQAETPPAAK